MAKRSKDDREPVEDEPEGTEDAPGGEEPGEQGPGRARRLGRRVGGAAGRLNRHPKLVTATKLARELLPGDSRFGDPLSTAGNEQPRLVGRRFAEITQERPGAMREAGLSALQVWRGISEARGRGRGDHDVAILFTDLVEFSDWALEAGDDAALELLRDVGEAIEPPVTRRGGEVVKRLGDGMMAVFDDPQSDRRRRLRGERVPGERRGRELRAQAARRPARGPAAAARGRLPRRGRERGRTRGRGGQGRRAARLRPRARAPRPGRARRRPLATGEGQGLPKDVSASPVRPSR